MPSSYLLRIYRLFFSGFLQGMANHRKKEQDSEQNDSWRSVLPVAPAVQRMPEVLEVLAEQLEEQMVVQMVQMVQMVQLAPACAMVDFEVD